MYVMNSDNEDPAFRYEGLLRTIFNCNKYGDPWQYAHQEYFINFDKGHLLKSQRALSTALNKIIWDYKDQSGIKNIKELDDKIWHSKNTKELIDYMDDTISWLENLKI